jgi:hypothetical protein
MAGLLFAWVCVLSGTLYAERSPLGPAELAQESDLILVGRILDLKVGVERSHIETGFGNYDWAIDLTLRIQSIEKGQYDSTDPIVVRCFRIKSRKAMVGYVSVSGNHPIPEVGEEVRAYLYRQGGLWRVVFPNGLGPVSSQIRLPDAAAIPASSSRAFTYWLPVEGWICLAGAWVILWIIFRLIRRFERRASVGRRH